MPPKIVAAASRLPVTPAHRYDLGRIPALTGRWVKEVSMTRRVKRLMGAATALAAVAAIGAAVAIPATPACAASAKKTTISFAEDIMPIFRGRCVGCHQSGGAGL
jgi:hypothetical protein